MKTSNINKLADYVLLNAYSVDSSGFYNGKAGFSLALFEIARLLQNDYLEEHAFELIQEALIDKKNTSDSFENGLAGIGYVLRYLIDNKFLDTDYKEIFEKEELTMHEKLFAVEKQSLTMGYYFNDAATVQRLVEHPVRELCQQFSEYPFLSSPIQIKNNVFEKYKTLLKVVTSCKERVDIFELMHNYAKLYRTGWAISDFFLGYYMKQLAQLGDDNEIQIISNKMMHYSLFNCRPELLSLSCCIDWLYLLRKDKMNHRREIQAIENKIITINEKELERILVHMIPSSALICGYEKGISRWLLYNVFCNLSQRGEDTSRFDGLFK